MLFLFMGLSVTAQNDLSLNTWLINSPAATNWVAGENVIFRVSLYNDGVQNNTGVTVRIPTPINMSGATVSSNSAGTSYTSGVWTIGAAMTAVTDSLFLEIQYTIDAGTDGVYTFIPEVSTMTETDVDSTPNNMAPAEDDASSTCLSVPIALVCGESLIADAPDLHTSYQWYKDGLILFGETDDTLTITETGTYIYTANEAISGCPASVCCPIIVTVGECASVGNYVWHDVDNDGVQEAGESPIAGVEVILYDDMGTELARDTTDTFGAYLFDNLPPDDYNITFIRTSAPTNYVPTQQSQGGDLALDSDPDPTTGVVGQFSLTAGQNKTDIDAGYFLPASIGDYVWFDEDNDGQQEAGEAGINGVIVNLYTSDGTFVATTTTATW